MTKAVLRICRELTGEVQSAPRPLISTQSEHWARGLCRQTWLKPSVSLWAAAERSCALWERADVKAKGKNRRKTGTEGFYFHGSASSTLCNDAGSMEVTATAAMNSLTACLFLGTVGLYLTLLFFCVCSFMEDVSRTKKKTGDFCVGKTLYF